LLKKDKWTYDGKNSHPLVLDQFRNSCTHHGSVCVEVACSTCVLHQCVRCRIWIYSPININSGPRRIWHTECIWKWNLRTVANSCTARLGSTSCGICSVVCQTWKSGSATSWGVARCAVPWLSYISGAIVLGWDSALSTDPALCSDICKWLGRSDF
jgi:hypothetical protein